MTIDLPALLDRVYYRYPSFLIDTIAEHEAGARMVAVKNVTVNEEFFQGHFPGSPLMPGVLMIEALAQAAGILAFRTLGQAIDPHSVFYFVGIDAARFKRPVGPGDQLRLEVRIRRVRSGIWQYDAWATVDEHRVVEAQLMCTMRRIDRSAAQTS